MFRSYALKLKTHCSVILLIKVKTISILLLIYFLCLMALAGQVLLVTNDSFFETKHRLERQRVKSCYNVVWCHCAAFTKYPS